MEKHTHYFDKHSVLHRPFPSTFQKKKKQVVERMIAQQIKL